MLWKDVFKKGQEIYLSTCSKDCEPNANVVISLGFADGKLLIADSQMDKTLKNLINSKNICAISKLNKKYYRIRGTVEVFNSGKYFDMCSDTDKNYPVKNAILITVTQVFDLDKVKIIL